MTEALPASTAQEAELVEQALNADPIDLPDGTILDTRQTATCHLAVTTRWSHGRIAKEVGYSSQATCSAFLRSKRGQLGVQSALRTHMQVAGIIGLQTMMSLAKGAKSENVRREAASDLMDRAGIGKHIVPALDEPGRSGSSGLNISISIGQSGGEVIDVSTRDERGEASPGEIEDAVEVRGEHGLE